MKEQNTRNKDELITMKNNESIIKMKLDIGKNEGAKH